MGPPEDRETTAALVTKFLGKRDKHEALAWLKSSNPKSVRYIAEWTTDESVDWIEKLYAAGASKVWAVDFARNAGYESVVWLLIVLPTDSVKRAETFDLANVMAETQGFNPKEDYGQRHLLIWFD